MMTVINYRDVIKDHYYITDDAKIFEKIDGKLVDISDKIRVNKSDGYCMIQLRSTTGYKKSYHIHRLVIGSFNGDRPDLVVDHLDMVKTNNHLSNLEFVTYDENLRRAAKAYGKRYRELFSEETVRSICELLEKGYNSRKIQRILGLSSADKKEQSAMDDSIVRIMYRINWTSISKDYNWDIDDVRLKVYTKEDLRLIAYMVIYSGYGPSEIAKCFPKYEYKQLNQVVKKMNQGKLYKKFLEEASSTTIAEGMDPPRDSDGFMRLMPTALGVKQLRKIRQDLKDKS